MYDDLNKWIQIKLMQYLLIVCMLYSNVDAFILLSVCYEITKIFSNFVNFVHLKVFWKAESKMILGVSIHFMKKTLQHCVKHHQRLDRERREYAFLTTIGGNQGADKRSRSSC